ncbi:MAG: hypothetical protein NWQ35_16010, partial [Verrucomicrobiales bacterium]|nr:hypothetical protein [Verrucomicrobiales bacterium]
RRTSLPRNLEHSPRASDKTLNPVPFGSGNEFSICQKIAFVEPIEMLRQVRIEYEGAFYHVMARGNWLRGSLRGFASPYLSR